MTSGSAEPAPARGVSVGGHKVIGAKHVRDGRPCQDDIAVVRAGPIAVVAVADGHGSSIHAEIGARIAVEVASEQLLAFAASLGTEHRADARAVHGLAQDPFRRLLVREWARRVREHAGADDVPLKDYGSTLLFALLTPEFLLLGQLGDGDLIVVDGGGAVSRPLPIDPRCFGEETSSLCLPDAATSLLVLAMPVPDEETLLLISTDGYGKSYQSDADFERIGPDYLAMVREIGMSGVSENLEEFLTAVTTGGSGDDVALGLVYLPPVPTQPIDVSDLPAAADIAIGESQAVNRDVSPAADASQGAGVSRSADVSPAAGVSPSADVSPAAGVSPAAEVSSAPNVSPAPEASGPRSTGGST